MRRGRDDQGAKEWIIRTIDEEKLSFMRGRIRRTMGVDEAAEEFFRKLRGAHDKGNKEWIVREVGRQKNGLGKTELYEGQYQEVEGGRGSN